jgi:flavodoxin
MKTLEVHLMKTLVAYFSWGGTTRRVAEEIKAEAGADIFEIKTATAYPQEFNACVEVAKKERQANARPALAGTVADMAQYDTVILCWPCWCGTMPQACFTFLEAYNFSSKTIAPLCTSGGSGLANAPADIKKLCPTATIKEGLAIRERDVLASQQAVKDWLKKCGIA